MNKILKTELTKILNIDYPIIQAPMFLVSNTKMAIEAVIQVLRDVFRP